MTNFRKKFAAYLKGKDITQTEAAEIMKVTQQSVSKLLSIDAPVSHSTKAKVLNSFPDFALFLAGKDAYYDLAKNAADNFEDLMKNPYFKSKVDAYAKEQIIKRLTNA